MELYLIRHAQSTNNILSPETRHQRVADAPLTELGQAQAARLARYLATGINPAAAETEQSAQSPEDAPTSHLRTGYNFTRLYCSAMVRALHTASFIAEALDLTPEVWIDLHEHGGVYLDDWEAGSRVGYPGQTRAQILAAFPGYILPDSITDQGWWRGDYEDWSACCGRAMRVARQLHQWAETDERIALVSHGGFIDALLKALFNSLPGRDLFYRQDNTSISRIDIRSDGRVRIQYLNRTEHLSLEHIAPR